MTLQQLASIDLYALSKAQLKNYVKEAREEWGKAIDLRSAKQPELIEYLQLFLNWKVEQVQEIEEVTPVEEVAPTFFEEIATVNDEASDTEDYTSCYRYQGHKIEVYQRLQEQFVSSVVSIGFTSTPRCLESWAMQLAEEAIDAHLSESEEGTTDTHYELRVIRFDGQHFSIAGTQLEAYSLLQAIAQAVSCGYTPTHWQSSLGGVGNQQTLRQQRDSNAVLLPAECIPLDYRRTYALIRDCDAAMLSLPEETLKAIKFLHSWDIKWQVRYCCKQWTVTTPGLETWISDSFGDVLLQLHNDRILTDADIQEIGKAALT